MCITGNGLKTQESLEEKLLRPAVIRPSLAAFEGLLEKNLEGASGLGRAKLANRRAVC